MLTVPTISIIRRLATLGALASVLGLVPPAGQAAEAAAPPDAAASPASPNQAKPVHFIYIENDLRAPGLTTSAERDETLVDYRYFEMSRYVKERAPRVFSANVLAADVTILPPQAADAELKLDFPADEPVVIMTATGFSKRKKILQAWVDVRFALRVYLRSPTGAASSAVLSQQFAVTMGPDPVLGVLRIRRLEPVFVDAMLVDLLSDMAAKGVVTLPQPKALRPADAI